MPADGPTSPDDPEWVDEIVRRALERAGADDIAEAQPTSTATPTEAQAPTTQAPTTHQAPTTPAEAPQPADPPQALRTHQAPEADHSRPAAVPISAPEPVQDGFGHGGSSGSATESRLPEPEDLVSAYPVGHATEAEAAVAEELRPTGYGAPYPDEPDDLDPRFDEALGIGAPEPEAVGSRMRGFLEWGAVIVGALAVALVIKTFLMQAYFIPSGSMEPTLQIGDRVLVNKLSYSFGDIGRGDLVVFNRPPSQSEGEDDLIKRVVALPGEVIEIREGEIFITTTESSDQQRLQEPYLAEGIQTTGLVDTANCVNPTPTSCEIPEDHVFVMGDNRPGSRDSRVFGPIEDDLIVGRAFLRVWPLGDVGFL